MRRAMILILLLALWALPAAAEALPASDALPATDVLPASDVLPGLSCTGTMPLRFAEQFRVDYYEGGYKLLTIGDGSRYLVVPEGGRAPDGLGDVRILQQPLDAVYLAATSAMALFDAVDGLDAIRLSGARAEGWAIPNARAAMEAGRILYAGKYSEPDYELLLSSGCDLAIESTMILHAPQVKEMIERLGIPVFIDRSSYETHPLGRTEWVKLYAAMLNREDAAAAFFDAQAAVLDGLAETPNTEKTVAFFYFTSDGGVNVRSAKDYVPAMIELAGGRYAFRDSLPRDDGRSTVRLSMEEFYAAAVDADYLIYNGSIDTSVGSLDALLAKSPLLADFRAVKEGSVYATDSSLFQATDTVAQLIADIHRMLTGGEGEMVFLRKLGD